MRIKPAFIFLFFGVLGLTAKESAIGLLSNNSNSLDQIGLQFSVGSYEIQSIVVNGESCAYVNLDGAALFEEKGLPMLPYVAKSVIIPNDAEMAVEVVDVKYKEVGINKFVPSKGVIYRNQNPQAIPFVFGNIYGKDVWYPEKPALIGTPYILRDMRGLVVYFQPFQYNPAKGVLRIAESMTVRVKRIGLSTINVLAAKNTGICPSFDLVYNEHFVNYQEVRPRYTYVPDGDKMIVIAASSLKSDVEPLVKWKNQKGINTVLYEYPSQTGGSGADAVKTFIQGKYTSDKITYVLIVGDNADIPTLNAGGGLSDPSFILLAGNDKYPDAFIGRFSSSSSTDIQTMVNKVLKYEKEPDPSGEWYHKATGIASDQGTPTDKVWVEGFRGKLMAYTYTEIDQFYDPGASASQVSTALNAGRGWVNYMGHGSNTSWGTTGFGSSNVSSLTNGNMTPIVISIACYNGTFDGDCFGEAFTKVSGKGALAFLGSSISQSWTPPQYAMKEMVEELITKDKCISIGAIIYNGECKMLDNGSDGNTFLTWTLFGDPSIMHFTDKPTALICSYPQTIGIGAQTVDVSFGASISGRACLYSEKNGILGSKILNNVSSASFSINVAADEQSIQLTVTGFNKVPFIKSIDIQSGPYLRVAAPKAGDVLWPGQEIGIDWQTGGGANVTNVKIEYSADNGSTYNAIIASTPNATPYKWTTPDINESDQCLVRVSQVGGSLIGVSGAFSIKQKAQILLDRDSLEVALKPDMSLDRKLNISNTGKGTLTYLVSQAGGPGKILINELYVSTNAFFDGCELWNQGGDIDISGWKLQWNDNQSSSGTYTFASGFVFKAGKTVVLMDQSTGTNDSTIYVGKNMSWDKATLECSIAILDKDGKGIDFVRTANNNDPAPTGTNWTGSGITLDQDYVCRQSNNDNDDATDWKGSTTGTINKLNPGQTPVSGGGWLVFTPKQGTVTALGNVDVTVTFNATGLANGVYYDTLFIAHNDPDKPSPIVVPCKFTVDPGVAILGDNQYNSLLFNVKYVSGKGNGGVVYFTVNAPSAKRELRVFDCRGSVVYEDNDGDIGPWYLTNRHSGRVASGVYFAVLKVKYKGQTIQLHKTIVGVK